MKMLGGKEKGDFRRKKRSTSSRIMSDENGVFENGRDKFFNTYLGKHLCYTPAFLYWILSIELLH